MTDTMTDTARIDALLAAYNAGRYARVTQLSEATDFLTTQDATRARVRMAVWEARLASSVESLDSAEPSIVLRAHLQNGERRYVVMLGKHDVTYATARALGGKVRESDLDNRDEACFGESATSAIESLFERIAMNLAK